MPPWLENQKETFIVDATLSHKVITIDMLNDKQKLAYDIVLNHYKQKLESQLLMILTDVAGSGKSYVIDCIRHLLREECKICAYFGTAAFNVKGRTLH